MLDESRVGGERRTGPAWQRWVQMLTQALVSGLFLGVRDDLPLPLRIREKIS